MEDELLARHVFVLREVAYVEGDMAREWRSFEAQYRAWDRRQVRSRREGGE